MYETPVACAESGRYRELIWALYSTHPLVPKKTKEEVARLGKEEVERLIEKCRGKEKRLYLTICQKYGVTPETTLKFSPTRQQRA